MRLRTVVEGSPAAVTITTSLLRSTGPPLTTRTHPAYPPPRPRTATVDAMRWLVAIAWLSACGSNGAPAPQATCASLTAKQCTETRTCLLESGTKSGVVCRAAVGCELRVTEHDVATLPYLEQHPELVKRCEADPACRYEDRGCFCPCNLSGFPQCNCACGGGLPPRCTKR